MFDWIYTLEHIFFSLVVASLVFLYINKGQEELFRVLVVGLKQFPGVELIIGLVLHNEVTGFVQNTSLAKDKSKRSVPRVTLPQKGLSKEELQKEIADMKGKDFNPEEGNIFAYVYTVGSEHSNLQEVAFEEFQEKSGHSFEHDALVQEAFSAFLHENALNPMIFPSLRKMETEVVSMTAAMLNGTDDVVGFLTSGGTESNLMAVKAYKTRISKLFPHIKNPEIVAPVTIHPTIDKAADYFGLKVIHTPVGPDFRADVKAMEKAITPNTVLLCASAPQFCHGIVDPIPEISHLALTKGLPFHVDACFGGFMLPWVEKLGYAVPKFDFRNPGVTSMSADVHKYGYCVKGASVVLYKNNDYRKHQIYAYAEWPGGLYGSPSMAGTRPGGNIAAAWASLKILGEEGFKEITQKLMETTNTMKEGVRKIDGLKILGNPHMTCFAIGSTNPDIDIQAVADVMETKGGWKMERQQKPSSLHCSILPHHMPKADKFLDDLAESTKEVKNNKQLAKKGTAAMYGMIATIPDKAIISDFLVEFFSEVYK
ncbi:hypothetical protein FSP39_025176 [Pinctada imbricata]|uniref:sphinganine-1-phosphate aldolase n=1 Tax=Pinctada imbricata TaxID=66713 RepID=A0AA88XNS7_PINIB|nr:hypothetical protein FSP39_025176 [Pinctada imbricata]